MRFPLTPFILLVLLVAISSWQASEAWFRKKSAGPQVPYTNIEQLAQNFVEFVPNQPLLYPDNLDLFHIEAKRRVLGAAILSPDQRMMATTEVVLMPDSLDTTSRVMVSPIGRPPTIQEYLKPKALAQVDAYAAHPTKKNIPYVSLYDINTQGFYKQFQFDYQGPQVKTLLKTDPQYSKRYDAHIYHLVDWSPRGDSLLLSYREGVFHTGIYKTIPVLVNVYTGESTAYRDLQPLAWDKYCSPVSIERHERLCSEFVQKNTVTDIRILGWNRGVEDEILLKLLKFESSATQGGKQEQVLGYYSYNLTQNTLSDLGPTLPPENVAGYGWIVKFKDVSSGNLDASESHATQVIPKAPPEAKKLRPAHPRHRWLY